MGSTLWDYYVRLAHELTGRSLDGIDSLDTWKAERPARRTAFYRTMGLHPLPERCDLAPRIAGEFSGEGYHVQKVSFHILREAHATANIYRPRPLPRGRLPGVLYLCGHALIGVLELQEHAMMWARRGYVCLILDSIEQHDNRGDHHAVFLGKRRDWISRGYSAAGGELWNGMRALDLLISLPEVDPDRVGVTGLSGGGAQSFYVAAADERVRAAATVCGVGVLRSLMERRQWQRLCDCMYPWNMLQQDSADWAALIAPRPLLYCFAEGDELFAPDAYHLLHEKTKGIYELYGCPENCELFEYPGQHGYRPEAVAAINRWLDRHVASTEHPAAALPRHAHDELAATVWNGEVPETDHLDLLPELLSRRGSVPLPADDEEWRSARGLVRERLLAGPLSWLRRSEERLRAERCGAFLRVQDQATDQGPRRFLPFRGEIAGVEVWIESSLPPRLTGKVLLGLVGPGESSLEVSGRLIPLCGAHGLVIFEPRGAGLGAFDGSDHRFAPHLSRAGAYLGLTGTLLAIHDVLRALELLRALPELAGQRFVLYGRGDAGVACLYAAILDDEVAGAVAHAIPTTHCEGAYIVGILPVMDIPHAIGLLAPRPVAIPEFGPVRDLWADRAYRRLGCIDRFTWGGPLPPAVERVLEVS